MFNNSSWVTVWFTKSLTRERFTASFKIFAPKLRINASGCEGNSEQGIIQLFRTISTLGIMSKRDENIDCKIRFP